jgi:hypothetical protein
MGLGLMSLLLAGCVSLGSTDAVKEANELAISCRTDEALSLAARTSHGQTLAGGLAELQRVVFLRDAGRSAEADKVLDARYRRINATATARAETERAVETSLGELRAERRERTGRSLCR